MSGWTNGTVFSLEDLRIGSMEVRRCRHTVTSRDWGHRERMLTQKRLWKDHAGKRKPGINSCLDSVMGTEKFQVEGPAWALRMEAQNYKDKREKDKVGKGRKSRGQEGARHGVCIKSQKPGPAIKVKWWTGAKDSQCLKSEVNILIIVVIYFYPSASFLWPVASYSWVREDSLWVDSTKLKSLGIFQWKRNSICFVINCPAIEAT